jgi:hypothetical protein
VAPIFELSRAHFFDRCAYCAAEGVLTFEMNSNSQEVANCRSGETSCEASMKYFSIEKSLENYNKSRELCGGQPAPNSTPAAQKGAQDQAIGRSRGGLGTNIHLVAVRGLRYPLPFVLTAGQKGDAPKAATIMGDAPAEFVIADTAYDADHVRDAAEKGAEAVIPSTPSRSLKCPLDEHLYGATSSNAASAS